MSVTTVSHFEVQSQDGTLVPVWRSGSGPPVVLVHGAGGDHAAWNAVRRFLEPHLTVLAIDRPRMQLDPLHPYDLESEFEDIAAVVRSLDKPAALVGHSSGAVCALGASLLLPELSHLVLYEPPLLDFAGPVLRELRDLLTAGEYEAVAEGFLRDAVKSPEPVIQRLKASPAWPVHVQRAAYTVRDFEALYRWRPDHASFRDVKTRTLLLIGGDTPADHHHRGYGAMLRPALPDLRVHEIPGQQHGALFTAPELFASMVLEFLEED
jgi:pimeloyl-ACP methyl ester carboxylesterase